MNIRAWLAKFSITLEAVEEKYAEAKKSGASEKELKEIRDYAVLLIHIKGILEGLQCAEHKELYDDLINEVIESFRGD